jgi:nucleoside-diphosphate-sugar epimerase
MRILLIGGNGFIGRHVVDALHAQHRLAVFHRGGASPFPADIVEIHGDRHRLLDSTAELQRFAPDIVVDMILSSGPQAEDLLALFRGVARRILMLSSMDVYRAIGIAHGLESGPLQPVPLTEESELRQTLHPYTPAEIEHLRPLFTWVTDDYDKIPAERIIMSDPELSGTVLRLPMIYGPGDPLHRNYPIVRRIADGRRHILLPETLAAWRSARGYVENVAAAIALAATDDRAAHRIFNVCEEPPFSELEWAQKIAETTGWDGEFVTLPDEQTPPHLLRPGNAAQHWSASSARIRAELGFQEPVPLNEALRQTIRWELDHPPTGAPDFDYAAEDAALAARGS